MLLELERNGNWPKGKTWRSKLPESSSVCAQRVVNSGLYLKHGTFQRELGPIVSFYHSTNEFENLQINQKFNAVALHARHGGCAEQPAVNKLNIQIPLACMHACKELAPCGNHPPACTVVGQLCSSFCHRHKAADVLFKPHHQSLPGIHFSSLHMRIISQLALLTRPRSECCFVSSRGLKTLSCPFGGGTGGTNPRLLVLQCNRMSPLSDGSVLASYGATSGAAAAVSALFKTSKRFFSSCHCLCCRGFWMGRRQVEQSNGLLS